MKTKEKVSILQPHPSVDPATLKFQFTNGSIVKDKLKERKIPESLNLKLIVLKSLESDQVILSSINSKEASSFQQELSTAIHFVIL